MALTLQYKEVINRLKFIPSVPENMIVKILIKGHQHSHNPVEEPQIVRVEFTSMNDYFFLYIHEMEHDGFEQFRSDQELKKDTEFKNYPTMLIKLFNSVIETPETYKIQMDLNKDNTGLLKF